MTHLEQMRLQRIAESAAMRKADSTRRKCFISYHAADADEVAAFLQDFGTEFIAKTIGVTDEDEFIDSENSDYVMERIRSQYLGDSTVTIVLIGKCTWARRYVDWEVYSSLRGSKNSKINGLLAIQLPSGADSSAPLPDRVSDNVIRDSTGDVGYARYMAYPKDKSAVRRWIEDAYSARSTRASLIVNNRDRRQRSATCS